ncbi:hypothetical protein DH2020_007710 [Rehmannia glutinosa]|uniref:Peptidase A1 domain-containing protein n=1 Tax=Rehmannia glutinosa TaxID=99300 RepID=A0ABR0TZF5_REHGL
MGKTNLFGAILVLFLAVDAYAAKPIYSSRLIHRFSEEAQNLLASRNKTTSWPEKKTFGHMRVLLGNDLKRQRLRLGAQNQPLVDSQGGQTYNYGNDMGFPNPPITCALISFSGVSPKMGTTWFLAGSLSKKLKRLHYTWIDIGTPNNSFLVALDTGSDMLWVPCDCIECAPLSLSYYNMLHLELIFECSVVIGASIMQDKELGEYSPSHSSSSKRITCRHELCEMGPNCKTPNGHCPYTVNYLSEDTSSSGFLFEDQLHLASVGGNKQQSSVQAAIIIGCGSKQSGEYLDGIAPDGLMGLGPGDISIPSLLTKSGLIPHSFSFCYDKSYSGRLYFGDQGPVSQRSTSFLPLKGNQYDIAYIVEVETYCVGSSCLKQTGFKAQVDTGSSFTYLPSESYNQVVSEFHRQANATRITTQGFENCYKARSLNVLNIPSMKLVFLVNQSFVIENPMFHIADDQDHSEDLNHVFLHCPFTISLRYRVLWEMDAAYLFMYNAENFLMGYRLVFDWERLKLGWSISNCQDIDNGDEIHLTPPPSDASPNPLPTTEQQQNPHGHAVAPAIAGRATPKPSEASLRLIPYHMHGSSAMPACFGSLLESARKCYEV